MSPSDFIREFVNIFSWILTLAIFARVLLSWVPIGGNHPIVAIVYQITEPILGPLRRVVPRVGMFDLSPMIAIVLLGFFRWAVQGL